MNDNYIVDFLSALDQKRSQKQVNADIKTLEKTINMLRLTATLAQGSSKKEINAYIKQLSGQLSTIKLKAQIDNKNLKSEVNKALNNVSFKDIDALSIDENKAKLKVQKVLADTKAYVEKNPISVGINYEMRRNKLDNDLTAYLNRNSKINESSVLLGEANKVRDLIGAINDKKSLSEATDSFRLFKSEVASTGYNTQSTTDKIKSMLGHVTKISSAFGVASLATRQFVKSAKELKEINTLLTEISKANEKLSKSDLNKIGDGSFGVASRYGRTATDYLLGVQEASRAGYENATDIAELSVAAQGAGDMTAKLANQYLIATDKAYKFGGSVEKLTEVLDGSNFITNHNAVNMTELSESMSIVGSTAASFGVDVDKATAALGTMIATTQQSGSEVARAFKAILLNIRQVSDEEEGIDTEGLTKYENACNALNVKLKETKNGVLSLRDPMEVLKELSIEYNKLEETDIRRTNLLSSIGGKLRATQLDALLRQWDTYETMLQQYAEGTGSMEVEAEKTAKSLEGRLNSLSNSFTSFVNTITNEDVALNGISFFDKMVQGAESFVDTFGTIPTVLTAVNSSMVAMNKNYGISKIWDKETKKIDLEGNLFGIDISRIKNLKKHYDEAGEAITKWNRELKGGKVDIEAFNDSVVQNSASLKEYLSTCSKDAPASLNEYRDYLQKTGHATENLRLKTILLNTALTLIGSIAVQAIITGIAQAFDKFNDTVVESKQRIDGVNSKISDLKSQIEELNNLEYKSEFDNQKISQLERELELQEKILEIEQKRLYQNQIGTKFSDYFDEDSLVAKRESELDRRNKEGYTYLSLKFKADKSSIDDIESEISSLQDQLANGALNGYEDEAEMRINQLIEDRNELLEKQQTIEDQLTVNAGKYLENYEVAKAAVESGLLTGEDLEKAESMAEYWNSLYQESLGIVTNIQKMRGTYDNTNDLLEEKFGNISRDDLASLSDDEKRIALSFDPNNDIGFEELKQQIAETKSDAEGLNATEIKTFDQAWADSFTSENDAVKELGGSLLELAEQGRLTIETFNEADSTDYFKNLDISADEAVSKINKLVDESKQLSSMSSQISSMADALGTKQENGFVEADTLSGFDVEVRGLESWDRFQEVLGSTTSSYEECQEAANALATEWVNSSDFLAQLTEQNREYYATQLEAMGIENYEEVISYAMALNEAKEVLSQSSLMLGEATQDEIEALIAEGTYSELTANMILALYDAKIAEQAATIDTSADCANLIALAGDTDRTSQSIQFLIQLMNIYSTLESSMYAENDFVRTSALAAVTGIKTQLEAIANGETAKMEIEPTVKLGNRGKSSAKSAGKDAGKSYKDGLKEELSDLEGIISSLSKSIDGQKEVITSQKEVALDAIESQIDALEEERDARLAVIDAQKKQLEEQIKAIEKQIKAKNDEIKAINDAATARQHEIDLQKAQYELERMQNQRVILQYSEEKGMHYVADESGIRDAREDVDDAKRQLKIDAIEREIDLLENKKDLLSEQIDLLDEQADNINKYYDSQIKSLEKQKESTEKYFESLINSIENSKSKYQELLDIVDKAELSGKLKQLGIDEEALLNGSEEEFEKLKNAYLDVVFQVNEGNEEMLSSLRELSGYEGTAPAVLTDTSEKLDDMNTKLDGSTESMDKLSSSATTASEGASSIATSMGELGTNTEGISDNLTNINDALNGLPEADKLADLAAKFTSLGEAIQAVADVLGIGEEGAVSTLVSALNEISTLSLDGGGDGGEEGAGGGIISQFNNLKTAVDDVTNAISGGGSSGSTGGGDASNSSSPSMSAGAGDGEGASGLISAIGEIKPATDEALGGGGGDGEESEGEGSGAIPQFRELKTAVDEVTAAIGTADSKEGEKTGGEGAESTTLIGALRAQYETASETIPETKSLFEELLEVIMSCVGALNNMVSLMGSMADAGGGLGGSAVNIKPNAKGTAGNAFAGGTGRYKGLADREKNALVSEYGQPEITVLPNGKTILTDKPTLMDLPKDTVIFNEEQTKKIMDSKVDVSGNAYASGTDNGSVPYQPTGELAALMDFCKQNVKSILKSEQEIALTVHEMQKQINNGIMSGINSVTNTAINNISNNNKPGVVIGDINVTCPGVTSQQVAEQIGSVLGKELNKKFSGMHLEAEQRSRIR